MEYLLLAKIGFVIDTLVKGGYAIAGGYMVKTAVRYVRDYKDSVARENGVK